MAEAILGTTIGGKYRLLALLGEGAMGVVYRAEQLDSEGEVLREVALKMIQSGFSRDPSFARRFLREVRVAAKLRSPHAVTVYDTGQTDDGLVYYAMEIIHGRTLRKVMEQESPFSLERVVQLVVQVCEALAEAHGLAEPIVHRDLKPANIFVEERRGLEWVNVGDFGIAKVLGEETSGLTHTGASPGTPRYMAPEQWKGERIDGRADLYALGVILYELLAGHPPFSASEGPLSLMYQHVQNPPPPLSETIPPGLRRVTEQLLAKSPQDRPADAQQVRAMLEAALTADEKTVASWIGGQDLVTEVATSGTKSRPQERKVETPTRVTRDAIATVTSSSRLPWMLGAMAVLAIAGVFVGPQWFRSQPWQEATSPPLVSTPSPQPPQTESQVAAVVTSPPPPPVEAPPAKKTESAPPPIQKVEPLPVQTTPQPQKQPEVSSPRNDAPRTSEVTAKITEPQTAPPLTPSQVEKEDPSVAGAYETVAAATVVAEPKSDASVVARLSPRTKVTVLAGVGDYVKVESRKGNPPGYIARRDLAPVQREAVATTEAASTSSFAGGASSERTDAILTDIRPISGDAQLACRAMDRAKLATLGRMRVIRLKPIRDRALEALRQGRYHEAITAYESLLQVGPDFIETLMGLARAYHASHQPNPAIDYATRTIQRCALPEAYFIVASSFLMKGDKKRALAWLDVSLQGGFRERQRIEEYFSPLKNDPAYVALLRRPS